MEGLFTLLLFAVLFFVMMRYGCGAHMMHHGKQHGSTHHDTPPNRHRNDTDPVCGMKVDPDQAYSKTVDGTTWWFCSRSCLDSFEAEPSRYIPHQSGNNGHGHHHAGGAS